MGFYYEIQSNEGDGWISPWPNYLSGLSGCSEDPITIKCANGLEYNKETEEVFLTNQQGQVNPDSFALVSDNKFEIRNYDSNIGASISLIPSNEGYTSILSQKELTGSMFNRLFFFKGQNLKCFELFDD